MSRTTDLAVPVFLEPPEDPPPERLPEEPDPEEPEEPDEPDDPDEPPPRPALLPPPLLFSK